jgi:uncharacterized membrane protein YoaK (UPF0700 family)
MTRRCATRGSVDAAWTALVAAAICAAIVVAYLWVLSSESGQELSEPRVVFVAVFLAATALAAAGGALASSPPIRRACLAAAGTGLVAWSSQPSQRWQADLR